MLIYIEVDVDVQRPEGSSPTHTLPSLSGGDNERGSEEKGKEIHSFLHPGEPQEVRHLETTKFAFIKCHIKKKKKIYFSDIMCSQEHLIHQVIALNQIIILPQLPPSHFFK